MKPNASLKSLNVNFLVMASRPSTSLQPSSLASALLRVLPTLRPSDLLVVTADHGNDPSTPSTDHSREFVPVLITGGTRAPEGPAKAGPHVRQGVDIGTRRTFADLGQTLAENFGVGPLSHGTSFLEDIVVHHP